MSLELGLSLGLSPRESIGRFVSLGARVEAIGANAMWIVDSQLAMKDAYMALAILARETKTLKIGPGVTNLTTRHETVVANAMATLATLAPGRVLVGVGAGDSSVFPLGLQPMSIAGCDAGIRRLRSLLDGGAARYAGGDVALSFKPEPVPPIYLSASQPRMLHLAGAIADGVIIMGPSDADTVRMQMSQVDEGARQAGRNPQEVTRDLWATMAVGGASAVNDVKSWASAQARWLARWKQVPASLEVYRAEMIHAAETYDFGTHLSRSADHAAGISDEFAKALAVVGDVEECRRRLQSLIMPGISRVTITLLSGGRERRLDEIAAVWRGVKALAPA
jgi:5,10-methylenetetrahydromethanopterin reductase